MHVANAIDMGKTMSESVQYEILLVCPYSVLGACYSLQNSKVDSTTCIYLIITYELNISSIGDLHSPIALRAATNGGTCELW